MLDRTIVLGMIAACMLATPVEKATRRAGSLDVR
jgi:hypothetical protein